MYGVIEVVFMQEMVIEHIMITLGIVSSFVQSE